MSPANTAMVGNEIPRQIRFALLVGFSFVILLMGLIMLVGLAALAANERVKEIAENSGEKTRLVYDMRIAARERNMALLSMMVSSDAFVRDEQWQVLLANGTVFLHAREQLQALGLSQQERVLLQRQQEMSKVAVPLQNQSIDFVMQGRIDEAFERLDATLEAQSLVFKALDELLSYQQQQTALAYQAADDSYARMKIQFIVLFSAASALTLFITWFMIHRTSALTLHMEKERLKFETLFEGTIDAVLLTDKGRIVDCNSAAVTLFGIENKQVMCRMSLVDLGLQTQAGGMSVRNALALWFDWVMKDKQLRLEWCCVCRDGRKFPAAMQLSTIILDGRLHVQAVIRDVSQQKQAEKVLKNSQAMLEQRVKQRTAELQSAQQQLMQSDKMASVGQLAAGVAHEINNPVGYIGSNISSLQGYTEELFAVLDAYLEAENESAGESAVWQRVRELKQKSNLEFLREDVVDLVRESLEGITRVKQIVQDLKDFSHVDEAEWQVFDVHAGLDSTLNVARNEIKYKADVIKEYGQLPPLECIPSQLNQVFLNLFVNAAHAIEEHGTITIRTGVQDDMAWVDVSDTGGGIDEAHLEKIFDPFFTTKPVGTGTGLGLALSYGIIKKHNGRIEVKSTQGVGTAFRIFLPLKQEKSDAMNPANEEAAAASEVLNAKDMH